MSTERQPSPPQRLPERVLFLAPFLDAGGVTTHMKTLAQGLQRRGVTVAVASRGREEEHTHGPDWFEADGIAHFTVPFPLRKHPAHMIGGAFRAMKALKKHVRAFRPDLLHVHWRAVSIYAHLIEQRLHIPYVTTLHAVNTPSTLPHRLASFWGTRTICVSREARTFLLSAFPVSSDQVRLVPHGIDVEHYRPATPAEGAAARARIRLRPDDAVIACVGSLFPNKGHRFLLEALAILHARGVRAVALLAGTGDAERIRAQASRLGIPDHVRLLGYTDARAVLWCADVHALPSRHEAFALSVAEAMLCGVVPVRTLGGGSHEQIDDGVTGFLVPYADAEALAERLYALLTDQPLRTRMARAALAAARRAFTMDRMVEQTLAVYAETLHEASAR